METTTPEQQLFDAVTELTPLLRSGGVSGEAERDPLPETIQVLRANGFFRIWRPRAFGGMELHPTTAMRVFEELGRVDSAVGWLVANAAVITTFFQVFSDDGLKEIFAEPDTLVAGGWFPPGAATPVDGGYRVSGQWAFGSGCRHADWLTGMAVILGADGQPELGRTDHRACWW